MTYRTYNIQGRFLGMPYDWRRPTVRKVLDRIWDPNGAVFPPKIYGMGWTINFARPAAWAFLAGMTTFCVALVTLLA